MKQLAMLLRQVGRNYRQTWGTQLMTLLTVVLSVLIFSFFFLVYMNMLRASDRLGDDIRIIVYLDEEPVPELRPQIERKIREFSEVDRIAFVSRQEAYNRLAKQLGNDRDVLADLGPSFLPPSIEVYPQKNLKNLARVEEFARYLHTLPGAAKVQYGHGWLQRFSYFTNLLQIIVLMSGALLILSMTFIVSYTIRLTVIARQEELEILRLLGASSFYIRGPLLVEGILQGLLGSGLGLYALYLLFHWIAQKFSGPGLLNLFDFRFFSPLMMAIILMVSVLLCAAGTTFSIRRFLRI
ncbi:MAG: cell division protein FtsX [Thermodesulfobacteriota bacterium]